MREFKFRIWDKQGKKMCRPGTLKEFMEHDAVVIPAGEEHFIMQFIGRADKNGKDIFEGDIVRQNFENEMGSFELGVGSVVYCQTCSAFHVLQKDQEPDTGFSIGTECEVVGNVYQNPELLTV